jgi:acyl-coenzyme A thioesterase PaaI-like protein
MAVENLPRYRDLGAIYSRRAWADRALGPPMLEADDNAVVGRVATGAWLSWDGKMPALGSLAVLVDDVLGAAVIRSSPDELLVWVTTEMTIDLLNPPPANARELIARAHCQHIDRHSGFASGDIRADDGALVATATERLRGIRVQGVADEPTTTFADRAAGTYLGDLLWPEGDRPRTASDGDTLVPIGPRMVNRIGNMHGGIAFLLGEGLALAAARRDVGPMTTASVHAVYLRPLLVGTTCTFETEKIHRGRTSGLIRVVGRTQDGKPGVVITVALH